MELTTLSTPSFGSGAVTIVSLSSACAAHMQGGGGVFHEGWGLAEVAFC
jgi:hypothetical protein